MADGWIGEKQKDRQTPWVVVLPFMMFACSPMIIVQITGRTARAHKH